MYVAICSCNIFVDCIEIARRDSLLLHDAGQLIFYIYSEIVD